MKKSKKRRRKKGGSVVFGEFSAVSDVLDQGQPWPAMMVVEIPEKGVDAGHFWPLLDRLKKVAKYGVLLEHTPPKNSEVLFFFEDSAFNDFVERSKSEGGTFGPKSKVDIEKLRHG